MARLDPDTFDPITSWRFKIQFSKLANVNFYAKSVTLPQIDNSPLIVEYGNTQMKIKGKTKWNDIDMTMYAYEYMTLEELWDYMNKLHQDIEKGTDYYGDNYKNDILIQIVAPNDAPIATWTLVGAFINILNFGEFDYSSEDIVQPKLTISYDYALFKGNNAQTLTTP
mgnify:CR=1 FL=1